jgi:hypothetical protein
MNVVKFPYRPRVNARRPRRSKNGTPEEREAAARSIPEAAVIEISRRSVAVDFEAQRRVLLDMALALDEEKQRILLDHLRHLTAKHKP